MANKPISMLRVRKMLQMLEKGVSQRNIGQELNLGRTTVSDYLSRIGLSGKSYETLLIVTR